MQTMTHVRTLAREEVDWNAVYAELLPKVYNYFRYRLGDSPTAEDLTAITFEKAWSKRHQYRRDKAAFSTWLYTIAGRVAIDYYRRQPAQPDAPLEMAERISNGPDVEEQVLARQDQDYLTALLEDLPLREREIVALKYGAGLNNRQIARLTNLSESNIGSILHRTVQKLRSNWEVGL
jgi:RNA polymerase sigma-70 factor, ECF subfamily